MQGMNSEQLMAWLADVIQWGGLDPAVVSAARQEQARVGERLPSDGASSAPRYRRGRPNDWAHDGTEVHGHPEPGYRCLLCRDSGFVRREVEVGAPEFGKAHPCRCQSESGEMQAARRRRRVAKSGLPEGLRGKTFDTLRRLAWTEEAWGVLHEFLDIQRTGGEPLWVVLDGGTGRGKTHLLAATAHVLLTWQEVFWADVPEFLATCKADGLVDGERRQFALDEPLTRLAEQAPVLILDEFGSQSAGAWAREKFERLLNRRYEQRLPTLFGLTADLDELHAWSPRIVSRLRDASLVRWVALEGEDMRPRLQRPKGAA